MTIVFFLSFFLFFFLSLFLSFFLSFILSFFLSFFTIRYFLLRTFFFPSSLIPIYHLFPYFSGIAEFAKESASRNLGAPKVHLSFSLDGSGVVTLAKAEVRVCVCRGGGVAGV